MTVDRLILFDGSVLSRVPMWGWGGISAIKAAAGVGREGARMVRLDEVGGGAQGALPTRKANQVRLMGSDHQPPPHEAIEEVGTGTNAGVHRV